MGTWGVFYGLLGLIGFALLMVLAVWGLASLIPRKP